MKPGDYLFLKCDIYLNKDKQFLGIVYVRKLPFENCYNHIPCFEN